QKLLGWRPRVKRIVLGRKQRDCGYLHAVTGELFINQAEIIFDRLRRLVKEQNIVDAGHYHGVLKLTPIHRIIEAIEDHLGGVARETEISDDDAPLSEQLIEPRMIAVVKAGDRVPERTDSANRGHAERIRHRRGLRAIEKICAKSKMFEDE